ncbi:4Fe-4S cluster-binding domain-containing protein [Anaerosporobacter faecicola]|uniref:4Fe-4S cluster-binding domain-containing protein n=1 Tax=Anaerosporobacter faecicola TaxID=2718714 RepID=UPI00143A86A0|nr:4Fe-4S cluster-binding domain-containing protein [Anaerosporobacter faecicola]
MYGLEKCKLCARNCGVDREAGKVGVCGQTSELVVARAALHMWEEPCISGENGSGAVFFSGCNIGCVFCQNQNIAKGDVGKKISLERLVEIFFELEQKGANNINLVTPTHYVPLIVEAIHRAREKGFSLPFVYNTGCYENLETIQMLDGCIDIYLPDMKYKDSTMSMRYSHAKDYFTVASRALEEMVRQVGEPVIDEKTGIMKKGVIVRHLLLPGGLMDSKEVVAYLYQTYHNKIFLSLMNQYTPLPQVASFPEINRKVTRYEYNKLVNYAIELGVENGFIQEGNTAKESFIPEFDLEGV